MSSHCSPAVCFGSSGASPPRVWEERDRSSCRRPPEPQELRPDPERAEALRHVKCEARSAKVVVTAANFLEEVSTTDATSHTTASVSPAVTARRTGGRRPRTGRLSPKGSPAGRLPPTTETPRTHGTCHPPCEDSVSGGSGDVEGAPSRTLSADATRRNPWRGERNSTGPQMPHPHRTTTKPGSQAPYRGPGIGNPARAA